ncbi:MAG: hypothetical protein IJO76_07115 [Clostridia bacterium]|nr:hypothetical protein [Clostridia bacterium]
MKVKEASNFKHAWHVFLRMVLATLLCVFLFLSMSVLTVGLLGSNVGYRIMEQAEDGTMVTVEEHYYELGEKEVTSLKLPEGQVLEQIRDVSDGVQTGVDIVTQAFMLLVVCAFPYTLLWALGDKDSVGVRYRGKKECLHRGFLIGLLGNVPYIVVYLILLASRFGLVPGGYLALFRLINLPFLPYINGIVPAAIASATDLSIWHLLGVLPVILVIPALCGIAYILGYKQISLQERATYAGVNKGNADTEI